MKSSRSKAIIAVFGSKRGLELANKIGSRIAEEHCITLTGGNGKGGDYVKERAIEGAGSSPWIGVSRKPPKRNVSPLRSGVVIHTDLGHRRNYLEACLCDAAIGIKDGPGTTSEVLFALSLQRPVALVGKWEDPSDPDVLDKMIEDSYKRVGTPPSERPDLDDLLDEKTVRRGLRTLPEWSFFNETDSADTIVGWVLDQVSSAPKKLGGFPKLKDYEDVAMNYLKWVTKVGQHSA